MVPLKRPELILKFIAAGQGSPNPMVVFDRAANNYNNPGTQWKISSPNIANPVELSAMLKPAPDFISPVINIFPSPGKGLQVAKPESGSLLLARPSGPSFNQKWTLEFHGPWFFIKQHPTSLCAQPLKSQTVEANMPLVLGPKSRNPIQGGQMYFTDNNTVFPANEEQLI
uniref:Uncharacterized protein n=1 Tax=Romanomermis culicivorax TaxID=13658 RepID=A0A915JHY4_ROMCU